MDSRQVRLMKLLLLVSSLASLLLLASAAYKEHFRDEWRTIQADYRARLINDTDDENARRVAQAFPIEQKQIYLSELGTIDRCTTCHLGVENPAMADAAIPLKPHPGTLLKSHPTERFGCTLCHQGEGRAISGTKAHGWYPDGRPVPHVRAPLLRGDAVYTSCGKCHSQIDLYGGEADLFAASDSAGAAPFGGTGAGWSIDEASLRRSLPGADAIARGKNSVVTLGCLGCHKYRGRGGVLGPDITYVGDKTRHDFDFSHVKGEHTAPQWLFEHFKVPREVSPGSRMPDYGLSDEEARDLAAYMMSLHRKTGLADLTPRPATNRNTQPVRGETLFRMFCSACHGADGLGSTMRVGLWPTNADPWGHDWDASNIVLERRGNQDVMVPSLNHADTLAVASDDYLRHVITHGRPGTDMLGWSDEGGLSSDEIELIVAFIRRWQAPGPDPDGVASARGDARIGAALYRANCAACHGVNGEGGIGISLNAPTFLAVSSDAFLHDTILYGRPNTAMPAWREFDSRELSDLLAFLRRWQPARSDAAAVQALCRDDESTDVSPRIGEILFKANCVMCHGPQGAGDLGPSLNTQAFLTVATDAFLANTLIEGRPGTGMPSWRHFSNEDLASLIRYLRTWQSDPPKPDDWYAQLVPRGDPDAGRLLFASVCSGCHGADAEGATGPQLNNLAFLRNATDVMIREWITYGKSGTEMRGFLKGGQGVAELSPRQIENLVSYLRSLEYKPNGGILRVARSPNGRPEKGARTYSRSCSGCHGPRGEGASGPALSNPNFLRFASDGFLMASMVLGRSGTPMRPVKHGPESILDLSSDEVNDVVAHLRSWESDPPFGPARQVGVSKATAEIPHRFVVPWNLDRGRRLFASNCAGCHGNDGKDSWAPQLNNQGFLAAATDGFLQATIVRGRHGTAMRPFGGGAQGIADLTSDDIDDIVAYIRYWSTFAPSPMTIPAEHSIETADKRIINVPDPTQPKRVTASLWRSQGE
jgi:mono/diheme cytochrome c family protein